MNDRAYIFLILFLIAMGFYSYQQALHDRGGITLLDQFITGKEPASQEDAAFDATLQSFEFDQKLDELQGQIGAIKEKREVLLGADVKNIVSILDLTAQWDDHLYALARTLDVEVSVDVDPLEKSMLTEQALRYVQDLSELNGIVENELSFFLMNTQGSDFQLKENTGFLSEKIEKLVKQVDELDLKELAVVLKDFSNLDRETVKIRQNMHEHIQYLVQRHKTIQQVSLQILGFLNELIGTPAEALEEGLGQLNTVMVAKLNQAAKDTLTILQQYDEEIHLMYKTVELTAGQKHIDLEAFKEEIGLTTAAQAQTDPATGALTGASTAAIQQMSPGGSELDLLRERQKKDEEMLNTILKVYGSNPATDLLK